MSRILVKLGDSSLVPYKPQSGGALPPAWQEQWKRVGPPLPPPILLPAITALPPHEILALVERATTLDPTYQPPEFLGYFEVADYPEREAPQMAERLRELESVETAYVESRSGDPMGDPDDGLAGFPNQIYLHPAPDGIDAAFVWPRKDGGGFAGGDGAGVHLVDLEQGWTLDHEDLKAHGARLLNASRGGAILRESRGHGTGVLGIICAVANAVGCVGIAPHIDRVNVVSYHGTSRFNAIFAALGELECGDVLLLEAQLIPSGLPIELEQADYEAIRLATALGIVVVEAAGNGMSDLDATTDASGKHVLNRASDDFRDSGAILVAAGTPDAPHGRWTFTLTLSNDSTVTSGTNWGSRVDCFAWGERVFTLTSTEAGGTTGTTSDFKGTSAATAIVAGAAVLVQGMARAGLGLALSPRQVRRLLSDPELGTHSASAATDGIGVMPNLRAIVESGSLTRASDA